MKFTQIVRLTQSELKKALRETENFKSHDGFLYHKGTIPIMLVAHMDTVHKKKPRTINIQGGIASSPQGIGGDDRCGIYMILQIMKHHDCHVVFTEDEEIGCVGAEKFAKSKIAEKLKGKINYIIELDRRGSNDAVYYSCGNEDFKKFIESDKYWKRQYGSCSDICEIAPALDCAAVNLSSGYYHEHTLEEYVNLDEMRNNIKEVCKIIERSDDTRFEWIEDIDFGWGGYGYRYGAFSRGAYQYCDMGYCIVYNTSDGATTYDYAEGLTFEEAIGIFLMEHPNVCYNDIIEIYDDNFETQIL